MTDIVSNNSIKMLRTRSIDDLNEDKENLNYWILVSDRISKLYNEINQLL